MRLTTFRERFSRLPVKHQAQSRSRNQYLSASAPKLLRAGDPGLAEWRVMTSIIVNKVWAPRLAHAETIAVAVAEPDGEVCNLGTIANCEESIRMLIRKLGPAEHLRACYEAGPTGFLLYWQLSQLGVECAVVAPSQVPKKPGDRVKTDRRDALKLARSHRSGDLTAVWVPDEDSEALRDLVRKREAAKQDQLRAGIG
jgi:hypothetical protein